MYITTEQILIIISEIILTFEWIMMWLECGFVTSVSKAPPDYMGALDCSIAPLWFSFPFLQHACQNELIIDLKLIQGLKIAC